MTISLNRLDDELKFRRARLQTQMHALELKLTELEAQQRQNRLDLDATRQAFRQLATFLQEYQRQKICLPCWLKQKQSRLVTLEVKSDKEDLLKCPSCGQHYLEEL
jgi:chromosome segregation ATPase